MPGSRVGEDPQVLVAGQVQPIGVGAGLTVGSSRPHSPTGEYASSQKTLVLKANTWILSFRQDRGTPTPELCPVGPRMQAGSSEGKEVQGHWWVFPVFTEPLWVSGIITRWGHVVVRIGLGLP